MAITCIIRYEIEPTQKAEFEQYSKTWGRIIPQCGADLIGYFAPHEGTTTTAYGLYHVKSLTDYEAYRKRLASHPEGQANYEFAMREKFIRREERQFFTLASGQ